MQAVEIADLKLDKDEVSTQANLLSVRKEHDLARQLGLEQQRRRAQKSLEQLEKQIAAPFQTINAEPLSPWQLAVWREWLPTSYTGSDIGGYAYDRIPIPVMEQWTKVKEAGLFDWYEIRTPERVRIDPVLFGHRDGKVYLIARWGESEEQLISFEEINRRVRNRLKGTIKLIASIASIPPVAFALAILLRNDVLLAASIITLFPAMGSSFVFGPDWYARLRATQASR